METPKITMEETQEILSKGYPAPEDLKRFPFGELLFRLWTSDDGYREHGPKVLEYMNILLGNDPNKLLHNIGGSMDEYLLKDTQRDIEKIFKEFDFKTRALFRIAALYHDIGKYIIRDRHPTVGWYTMEYLNPDDKSGLKKLLGGREDYLQLLMIMIRDHDEFGVLSTGEASYPILLRAANSLGNNLDEQKQIISALMWLNLADMAGTPNILVTTDDLKKFIYDWRWFVNALEICHQKRERLDDYIIRESSREEYVEERIARLILEASRGIPLRDQEIRQNSSREHVRMLVRTAIETVYPTQNPRHAFATEFTHICKMDYGKRFFTNLVEFYEGPPVDGKRKLPKWSEKYVSTEDLIYSILAILRRLTSTYSAMTSIRNGTGSLIGVEMKDLTPDNAPEKTAQIIQLLQQSHYPGLSWLMSDCLAWYF